MGFWQQVKTGFSFGLGGGFGWTLGSTLARLVVRLAKLVIAAILAASVGYCSLMQLASHSQQQQSAPAHKPSSANYSRNPSGNY